MIGTGTFGSFHLISRLASGVEGSLEDVSKMVAASAGGSIVSDGAFISSEAAKAGRALIEDAVSVPTKLFSAVESFASVAGDGAGEGRHMHVVEPYLELVAPLSSPTRSLKNKNKLKNKNWYDTIVQSVYPKAGLKWNCLCSIPGWVSTYFFLCVDVHCIIVKSRWNFHHLPAFTRGIVASCLRFQRSVICRHQPCTFTFILANRSRTSLRARLTPQITPNLVDTTGTRTVNPPYSAVYSLMRNARLRLSGLLERVISKSNKETVQVTLLACHERSGACFPLTIEQAHWGLKYLNLIFVGVGKSAITNEGDISVGFSQKPGPHFVCKGGVVLAIVERQEVFHTVTHGSAPPNYNHKEMLGYGQTERACERLKNKLEHIGCNERWPDWSKRPSNKAGWTHVKIFTREIESISMVILWSKSGGQTQKARRAPTGIRLGTNRLPNYWLGSESGCGTTHADTITPEPALLEQQCSIYLAVPSSSPLTSYVRMRTTVNHVTGTVKRTVPYKDREVLIFGPDENQYQTMVLTTPRRVENHSGKTTLSTPDRDSNLDLTIIGSLVFCKSSTLDHAAMEAGRKTKKQNDKDFHSSDIETNACGCSVCEWFDLEREWKQARPSDNLESGTHFKVVSKTNMPGTQTSKKQTQPYGDFAALHLPACVLQHWASLVSLLGDDRTNRSDPSVEGLKLPKGAQPF
uniref:(California timema) hypothetical protein n=1 Tax=Timema californicum TaxID=61474 RepID=A0A7R9P6B7_TIMCA|nr:unnamed protein product [Timema californicum]